MTHQPRRVEEIHESIQSNLEGEIPGLTNFLDSSFNDTWIDAYAKEVREVEAKVLAAQFALWVDFAGRDDLSRTDLEQIGVDFTGWSDDEIQSLLDDLNELSEDVHLDQIGALVGLDRGQGSLATGEATITVANDSTQVQEGLEVATEPDVNGDYQTFLVDADQDGEISGSTTVTPASGQTTVTVDIIAQDVGDEYNVGANTITFLPDPDPGIESVNNTQETSGGENVQSNESYRNDLKGSVISQSGGGTAAGIEGSIEAVTGVSDVELDEFQDDDPPHVDVIVDGGSVSDVEDEIDVVRPAGIRHDLVRPETINVGFRAQVVGQDIDSQFTLSEGEDYVTSLGIGEAFRRVKLVQRLLNADSNILDIGSLTIPVVDVVDESHEFATGTNEYNLNFAPMLTVEQEEYLFRDTQSVYPTEYDNILDDSNVEVEAIVDGDETVLTKGTDYQVVDDNSDGNNDAIDFSVGGVNPDLRTNFEIEYHIHNDEFSTPTVTGTLTGTENSTFTAQTDYDIVDSGGTSVLSSPGTAGPPTTIDWSIGGDSPDDGTLFFIDYDIRRVVVNDQRTSIREKISLDGSRTDVNTIVPE